MTRHTVNNNTRTMSSNHGDVPMYIEFTPQDILDYASSSDGSSSDEYCDLLSLSYSDDDDTMSLTYEAPPPHASQRDDADGTDGCCDAPRWPHHQEAQQDASEDVHQATVGSQDSHQSPPRDENVVSHQDLDAMKQMIHEMLANPELLHRSPVYSRAATATTTHGSSIMSSPSPASHYSSHLHCSPGSSPSNSPQPRSPLSTSESEAKMSPRVKKLQRHAPNSQSIDYCQECSPPPQQQHQAANRVNIAKLMCAIPQLPFR